MSPVCTTGRTAAFRSTLTVSFVKSVNGCATFKATGTTEFGRALLGASHPAAWNGAIDEVNFYQRALSASEVSTLAQH